MAEAPITQDVVTIPRNLSDDGAANIVGMTRSALKAALADIGVPEKQLKMRVNQIWQWVYFWGVRDFAAMTNLSKDFRAMLSDHFEIRLPEVVHRQLSADGTRKYLVKIAGGHEIETVYIPEVDRGTLCISSQVGCTLTCSFCHTGTQKTSPEPYCWRNCRPDHAGARRFRRMAQSRRRVRRATTIAKQHCPDGYG